VGCSLSIDQILEMQEGSGVDLAIVAPDGVNEHRVGGFQFQGGTVMRINVSTTLADYLDGTADGDVEVLDLLFAIPSSVFILLPTGTICVMLDEEFDNGGTFSYNVLAQEATFDVAVGTKAVPISPLFANAIRGGALEFPFDLESTIPLTLLDAIGLASGTGSLVVTQPVDLYTSVALVSVSGDPADDIVIPLHVTGEVTLESTDTFPTPPLVLDCLEFFAGDPT